MTGPDLAPCVISFESRRGGDMARLLERRGFSVLSAPSMREVPLGDQTEALAFAETLMSGGCDVLVLLTGVGARMLVEAMCTRFAREQVIAALGRLTLVCRGPKPVAALRELSLRPTVTAGEPNTWRDVLATMDAQVPVRGRKVHVQEYGRENTLLLDALRERGALVEPVRVYGWTLPEDTGPLRAAVEAIVGHQADAVVFTSGQQVEHLFRVAREAGQDAPLRQSLLERVVVASIGPVTTEALQAHGLAADIEPEHPKMGHLAQALGARVREVLGAKRPQ